MKTLSGMRDALAEATRADLAQVRGENGGGSPVDEAALVDLLLQTAQEGVWVVDPEGETIFASQRFATMLGCSVEDLQGLPMSAVLDGPSLERLSSAARNAEHFALEVVLERFDAGTAWASVSGRPMGENRDGPRLLMVTDLSNLKNYERELELVTMYDALTGLPNRTLFEDRLSHALKRRTRFSLPVACLLVDIDGFVNIHDMYGSSSADELMKLVAARLLDRVRPEDTVARLRHDQFGILLDGVPGIEAAVNVARRLATAFEDGFAVGDDPMRLTASIGIALNTHDNQEAGELIRYASVAMLRARQKDQIGTGHAVFDAWQDVDVARRRRIDQELRAAIEQGDLRLHYQPFVDLNSGKIVGAEALVRWAHPNKGFIYPAEFIELADATGVIVDLGRWVFRTGFECLATWREQMSVADDFVLAVNVAERQLREPSFASELEGLLRDAGLPAGSVQLELGEGAATRLRARVAELRAIGVRIAVDDIGKGGASLEHLARLDVDVMKIDRSFIAGMGTALRDRAVVESILLFTQLLGIRVIAEGIEREDQLQLLREMGCPVGQGYYFARPTVAELFEESLARSTSPVM